MIQIKVPAYTTSGKEQGDLLKLKLGKDELEKLYEWAKNELKGEATETKIISEIKSLLDNAYDIQTEGLKISTVEHELKEEEANDNRAVRSNVKKHEALAAKAKPILEKMRIIYTEIEKLSEALSSIEQQKYRFSTHVLARVNELRELVTAIENELKRN